MKTYKIFGVEFGPVAWKQEKPANKRTAKFRTVAKRIQLLPGDTAKFLNISGGVTNNTSEILYGTFEREFKHKEKP